MAAFIGFIKDYWGVVVGIAGFFFGWGKFTAAKTYASKEDVSKLEHRVSAVEQSVKGLATQKDMHDLTLKLERLTGKIDKIEAISERMENTVRRQEDFLMNRGSL